MNTFDHWCLHTDSSVNMCLVSSWIAFPMNFCLNETAIELHVNDPHDAHVALLTIFTLSCSLKHAAGLPLIGVCLHY